MSRATTLADVTAGVQAAISGYTLALDDGRVDDVVATFCADGECTLPGMGTTQGTEALRALYESVKPRHPQRHLVFNTLITNWDDSNASAISDLVFLSMGKDGKWGTHLVGRYADTLRCVDGAWLFASRVATFVAAP